MYNVDQQLFSYCTAKFSDSTQCCVPVFDVTHELPLCHEHSTKVVSVLSLTPSNCCTWIIQILCNSISEMPLKKLEKYDITKSLDALLRSTPLGMKHMQFCVGVVTSEVIPDPCAGWMMYSVQTSHISNHPQRITTFGPPGDCPRLRFDSFDSCARYKFSSFIHSFISSLTAFCFPKCDFWRGFEGASNKNFLGSLSLAIFSGPLINFPIIRPLAIPLWSLGQPNPCCSAPNVRMKPLVLLHFTIPTHLPPTWMVAELIANVFLRHVTQVINSNVLNLSQSIKRFFRWPK